MKVKKQVTIRLDEFEPGIGVLTLVKGGTAVKSLPVEFTGQKYKQLGLAIADLLRHESRGNA